MSDLNRATIERDGVKVTIEIGDAPLDDVLEAIKDCLGGLGFYVKDLDLVEVEE